jgi:hypothetical protein
MSSYVTRGPSLGPAKPRRASPDAAAAGVPARPALPKLEGYMEKCKRKPGRLSISMWNRRWFMVNTTARELLYWKNKSAWESKVPCRGACVVVFNVDKIRRFKQLLRMSTAAFVFMGPNATRVGSRHHAFARGNGGRPARVEQRDIGGIGAMDIATRDGKWRVLQTPHTPGAEEGVRTCGAC